MLLISTILINAYIRNANVLDSSTRELTDSFSTKLTDSSSIEFIDSFLTKLIDSSTAWRILVLKNFYNFTKKKRWCCND